MLSVVSLTEFRPVTSMGLSIVFASSFNVTPSNTSVSSSKKSSCNNAKASASTNSASNSFSMDALLFTSGCKTSVNFKIWNESSSSIIALVSSTCIDVKVSSNSSGKASPDERPKSPIESFDARSSLDSATRASKVISFACKAFWALSIFARASFTSS